MQHRTFSLCLDTIYQFHASYVHAFAQMRSDVENRSSVSCGCMSTLHVAPKLKGSLAQYLQYDREDKEYFLDRTFQDEGIVHIKKG